MGEELVLLTEFSWTKVLIGIILGVTCFLFAVLMFAKWIKRTYGKGYADLEKFMFYVNGGTKYMNFGLWTDIPNDTLFSANRRLSDFMFEKGSLKNAGKILDVGIGYAEQDFYWVEKLGDNSKITGVDYNPKQVAAINKEIKLRKTDPKKFEAVVGNAVDLKFPSNTYDRVISLESAFHYPPRTKFFEESFRVLKEGGKLVIADIMLLNKTTWKHALSKYLSKKFMDIPEANMVTKNRVLSQLKAVGYEVECHDITKKTFAPFFNYFGRSYRFPRCTCFMGFVLQVVLKIVRDVSPHSYLVCVCTKPKK